MGTRVVYIYPAEWGKPDLYGEIVAIDEEDDTYYIFEAVHGHRKLVDTANMLEHGAVLRPMDIKEKYPIPKAYLSPAEKRVIAAKKKNTLR